MQIFSVVLNVSDLNSILPALSIVVTAVNIYKYIYKYKYKYKYKCKKEKKKGWACQYSHDPTAFPRKQVRTTQPSICFKSQFPRKIISISFPKERNTVDSLARNQLITTQPLCFKSEFP